METIIMTAIKKQFEEIHALLELNKNKKVDTIMPQLLELMARKNNASGQANTFIKDAEDNVIAIYCYYHKKWELISECAYGSKKGTATGYNTMCKQGVSMWTKQQRVKKQSEAGLLQLIISEELQAADLPLRQEQIAEEAKVIVPREDGYGYDTSEEAEDKHNSLINDADEVNTTTED
jgi:hypothetical protein